MHREFTTGKLTPRPPDCDWSRQITWPGYCSLIGRAALSSMIKCMQTALYLSRRVFHARSSWRHDFSINFPTLMLKLWASVKRYKGSEPGKVWERANVRGDKEISEGSVVYVVFSEKFMAEFRIFMSLSHWGYLTHCEKSELSSWSKAWRMKNIFELWLLCPGVSRCVRAARQSSNFSQFPRRDVKLETDLLHTWHKYGGRRLHSNSD